ncbi:unnamed protein product [Alopecurus aequalis]
MMSSVVSRLLCLKPATFVCLPTVLGSIGQDLSKQTALPLHLHKHISSHGPATHIVRWWKATAATAAVVSGGGGAFAHCRRYAETVPYTDRIHLIVRSTKLERRLGDHMFRHTMEMYGASKIVDPHSPESVRACRITSQLVRAIRRGLVVRSLKLGRSPEEARRQTRHLDGHHWATVIVRDRGFRARVAPGGKIILYSGCFDLLKTDAEIACAIAHEIAHVVARHGMRTLYWRKWWIPSRLRQYLRHRNEIEADHIGILLFAAAGYDPRVFPTTMEKILKPGPQEASDTHPSPKERMQILWQDKIMEGALELYREVKAITSLCLTLKGLKTNPRLSEFSFG